MKKQNPIRKLMILFCCIMLVAAFSMPTMADSSGDNKDTDGSGSVSVTATITWLGDKRESATVHLFANGKEVGNATLTEGNGWTHTFSDLAKVDSEGNEIKYTLDEDSIDGYTTAIYTPDYDSKNNKYIIIVKNTQLISVKVTKVWNGGSARSATVRLLGNGTEVNSLTLTADNNWTDSFNGLAKVDDDGNPITYTLTEDPITGYSSKITGDASSGFTVTNTKKTIDIPVTKVWFGDSASSATVHLLANGTEVDSLTLTADNNWTDTFEDLAQVDSYGNTITYTLTEDPITGYSSKITGDASSGFTVTNTKTISIPVTKKWVGGTGESATVRLYANGTEVDSATLTSDNEWKHTFTDLAQVDSYGNTITYTLTEDPISGYTSEVTGDAENGFVVTNTKNVEPTQATIDIPVSKEWASGTTKEPVTVELFRNGNATGITRTLNEANGWKSTFSGQPEYDSTGTKYIYTVKEITDDYTWSVSGSADKGFVITNGSREITAGDPPVRKTITGDIPSKDSRFYFTMTAKPEKSTLPTGMTEMPMPTAAGGSQSMTISVNGEGSGEFGDITFTEPGTYVYEVREKNTGVKGYDYDDTIYEVRYVVKEADDSTTGEHNVLTCERTILKDDLVQSSMTFSFTNKYTSPESPNSDGGNDNQGKENNDANSGKKVNGNNNSSTSTEQVSNSDTTVKNGSDSSSASTVHTDDMSNIGLWSIALTASAAAIMIILFLRKRLSKRN